MFSMGSSPELPRASALYGVCRPLYCPWPRRFSPSYLARPFPLPLDALRGTSGGATMTTPGGAGTTLWTAFLNLPRARPTGFHHRVGAPWLQRSGPSFCPGPMLQGGSYVRNDHKPTSSVHKKHNTLRSTLTPPAVLGCLDRGQAHTPARWKRFSLPLAKKVAKQFVEAFRDAYGDALCLSAYYRDAEPSIRRAEVLASRTSQRS